MTTEPTTSRTTGPRRIPEGTVLAGRYRVAEPVAEVAGSVVYDGEDVALAGRRVLVVATPVEDRERLARAWLEADTPWTATVLDVVALEGAAAGIFQLDSDAARMHGAGGASREQRAALLVDVARVLERTATTDRCYRVVEDGLLWVEGLPHDARLRAVPLPDLTADADAVRADDLAAFARLAAAQLFGIDPSTPPDRALAALPAPFGPALAPLYADDRAARLSGPFSAAALAVALGVTAGASRVPVPRAPAAAPDVRARVQAARSRARKKAIREIGGAFVLLALALLFGSRVLAQWRGNDVADDPIDEPAPVTEVEHSYVELAPMPAERVPSPEHFMTSTLDARYFDALDEDGPIPAGIGAIAIPAHRLRWRPYVRVFENPVGRVARVEFFEPGDLFVGFAVFAWDEASGRLRKRVDYGATGLPWRSRTFDWDAGTFEATLWSGEPEFPRCPTIAFTLDAFGRYSSWTCIGPDGDTGTFARGHRTEQFDLPSVHSSGPRTRLVRYLDEDGRPFPVRDAWVARREVRDASGLTTDETFLDAEERPVPDPDLGAASVRRGWGARSAWTRYLGPEQQPVVSYLGYHQLVEYFHELGGPRSRETLDVEGRLVAPEGSVVARTVFSLDHRGRIRSSRGFGVRGEPVEDANGVHQILYVRDAQDHVLRECHFGLDGPIASPALGGAHCVVTDVSVEGEIMGEAYYGVDGMPVLDDRAQVHRIAVDRDEQGRVVARRYFATDGDPAESWSGYHGIRLHYGESGALDRLDYFGVDGSPTTGVVGIHSVRYERDALGREIRRCFFDADDRPAPLAMGLAAGAACIDTAWNARGSVAWVRYRDTAGDPVSARFGPDFSAAGIYFDYTPAGRLVRQELLDTAGNTSREVVCSAAQQCIGASGWSWHLP